MSDGTMYRREGRYTPSALNATPKEVCQIGIEVARHLVEDIMPDSRTVELTPTIEVEISNRDYDSDTHNIIIWQNGKILLNFNTDFNNLPKLAQKLLEAYQG